MAKELVFKLVMDADVKNFVNNTKQSEDATKSFFDQIKQQSDKLKASSAETSKFLDNLIPKGTKELADGLTQSLTQATKIIDGAGNKAGEAANNFKDFGSKSSKALDQLNSDLVQAKQKLEQFSKTKATPEDIANAQAKVDALEKEVDQANHAFAGFKNAVDKANDSTEKTSGAADKAKAGINGLKTTYTALVGAMAALGLGLGLKELADTADAYTNLSTRIQIATKDGGNFQQAMSGVHQVALSTNSSLEATGTLFTKINDVGKQMGLTQQQSLDLTKTINQSIQIGGGSAQASEAAITQLSQALQSGVLRGDEFNSIMEQAPGLTSALAKGLGVTTGELRKMAEAGELTSERVVKAIQSQAADIQKTYDQFPATIGNALQRISTQWEILIGEMNQSSGASETAANALMVIADNLGIIKVFFDDIGEGFSWFGSKLAEIDPATIEAIKSALSDTYDVVKTLISSFAGIAETGWSAFTTVLDAISPLFSALLSGQDNVSGITTLFNVFRVALGLVSDAATGLNIGLKLLLAGLQFLSGGLTALQSKVLGFLGFEDLAKQAQDASDRIFAQAEKNASEANRLALQTKSATVAAIEDIRKTEDERNADRVANNEKTLTELIAQEEKHKTEYKAISDARIVANQQLLDAKKSGDQQAIASAEAALAEIDKKEKLYQAESRKIQDAKIAAAQAIADAMIQANGKIGESQLKLLNVQLAAQGLKAEFDNTGKIIVSAMDGATKSTETQVNATDAARKAAANLGIDIDQSLNRVSEKFRSGQNDVNAFAKGIGELGATGEQAGILTYQAWEKWAAQAKSPAEIDAAKTQLIEFEKQGVFSAKQVEMGMRYLDEVNGKLPNNISEVEKAYKLLGITSRDEANKMANSQIQAFNVMKSSGTASAEQIRQALINMADKIYASGDAAKIAWYQSQLAANGLTSAVDSTGKTVVNTYAEMDKAAEKHANKVSNDVTRAYREMGQAAREEADDTITAWNKAMAAKSEADAKNKTQRIGKDFTTYNLSDVQSKLTSMGYDEAEAAKLAKSIFAQATSVDKSKAMEARQSGGIYGDYYAKSYEDLINKGQTSIFGTQKIEALLAKAMTDTLTASVKNKSVDVNKLAPSVDVPMPKTDVDRSTDKTVKLEFNMNGQKAEVYTSEDNASSVEKMLREMEMLKKGM